MSSATLGYRPALDGARGIAIGFVLLAHFSTPDMDWIGLGAPWIGVDLFFVLSGFLITRLLLDEIQRHRQISLSAFWARRALRLLPLSLVVIGAVALVTAIVPNAFHRAGADVSSLRAILGALLYHTNWLQAFPGTHHEWALTATWSLSLEEQFYVIWPLVVAACALRRPERAAHRVAVASIVVIVASAAMRAYLNQNGSFDHIYNGLDSRAGQLCAGTLLAAVSVLRPRWVEQLGRLAPLALLGLFAVAGNYILDYKFWSLDYDIIAWASVIVVAGSLATGSTFGRLLANPLLRWLGLRAYALYLVHYPLFLFATAERFDGIPVRVLQVGRVLVAIGLADLAHRWIERPTLELRHRYPIFVGHRAAPSTDTAVPAPAPAFAGHDTDDDLVEATSPAPATPAPSRMATSGAQVAGSPLPPPR